MLHNFDRKFERNHDFETEYLKILYYDLSANYRETYKSYHYNRLCTIVQGTKHVRINSGDEFDYSTSDFILIPPNSGVEMEIKDPTIAIVYEISDKLIDDTRKKIQLNHDVDFKKMNAEVIREKIYDIEKPIRRINQTCMSGDPNRGISSRFYTLKSWSTISCASTLIQYDPNSKSDPTAYVIAKKSWDNLYNSQFTLKEVAAETQYVAF